MINFCVFKARLKSLHKPAEIYKRIVTPNAGGLLLIMMIGNNNTINLTYNALTATNKSLEDTARALSTGKRVAHASDDAAGFAIGLSMSSQVAALDRAIRNSQDGISLLQTAEGGLNQINSMLQRMRELSVQAANDTLTTQDRGYLQLEISELAQSIDNVAHNTTFNSKRLLDGSSAATWSSSDATTKLKVSGALTQIDQFGQKKQVEGNYRIDIRAQAGQSEVQKTHILDLTISEQIANTVTFTDDEGTTHNVIIKDTRVREATLGEMEGFNDANGKSLLTNPQTITINQGDGKQTTITLYSSDTLSDVSRKINTAISDGLGQGQYVDNKDKFCTVAEGTPGTSESVRQEETAYRPVYLREYDDATGEFGDLILDEFGAAQEITISDYAAYKEEYGEEQFNAMLASRELEEPTVKATLLIRSAVAGSAGRITFTADNEDLINAFGLSTIQQATDNVFHGSVYDAHSGQVLADNVLASGNTLTGVLGPNAAIEFDTMANVSAKWDEGSKRYILNSDSNAYTTTLHVVDKSASFQIGQGKGEDIYINIGDMRADTLGLNRVDVTTRANASRSITLLDNAIHEVSVQRAKIGTYQNELEYNANSLQQSSLHLQESESRINDADMAREYMEFVKFQILNNTGSSMLSQSSQNAQSLMSVIMQ